MSKVPITFIANTKNFLDVAPKPVPASRVVPNWFKNTPPYINDKKGIDPNNDPNSTIKKCMPVVDAMNAGYHIVLPCDVWVYNEGENRLKFQWSWDDITVVSVQAKQNHALYPTPDNCYNQAFKWVNHWITKTPKGWSCLFTHPMHHDDLPFRCLPALVDTDKFPEPVNFPFFLKKDFSGLIPKGTPIIQILPFKRDRFVSMYTFDKDNFFKKLWSKAHTEYFDRYLKHFRSPKVFEEGEVAKCPFAFLHSNKK
jgi:hypothetical protein